MTQNARLLNYLETHPNGITTLEAMQHLKILRLSQRVIELERLGYSISHTPEHTENGARVIRYKLITGESRELPAVSSARRAMKAEERDEPTIYGDDRRRLAASLPLAQDVTAHSNAVSSPPFAAPQVVHSLPTPSLVGSPAGAASYKPWLR